MLSESSSLNWNHLQILVYFFFILNVPLKEHAYPSKIHPCILLVNRMLHNCLLFQLDDRYNNRCMNFDNLACLPLGDQRECSDENLASSDIKHCWKCYSMMPVDRIWRLFSQNRGRYSKQCIIRLQNNIYQALYAWDKAFYPRWRNIILSESV